MFFFLEKDRKKRLKTIHSKCEKNKCTEIGSSEVFVGSFKSKKKFNKIKMEQLAHFVTKSFEYNNNRVLDVLNMATKSLMCENLKTSESSDVMSNGGDSDIDEDGDTVDIDITDMSSNDEATISHPKMDTESDNNNSVKDSPISMIRRSNKENGRQATRNWLISDSPKKKYEGLFSQHLTAP